MGYAREQPKFFPGAQVHLLERCGHWPFVDDPARVSSLLGPFLEDAFA